MAVSRTQRSNGQQERNQIDAVFCYRKENESGAIEKKKIERKKERKNIFMKSSDWNDSIDFPWRTHSKLCFYKANT